MGYREDIESAEKYIAAHLKESITVSDVAERSYYSYYHFCHVFRMITGRGVARYILEKKMSLAKEMLDGSRSVTYTAMELGFDTVSGFTKAFTRMYGISPSKYRASRLKKTQPESKGDTIMEPEIIKKESFKARCLVIRPESEIDILENGGYWIGKDIPELAAASHEDAFSKASAKVGTWMHDADGRELYYVYGDVTDDAEADPDHKVIEFPEAEYAVFKVPTASTHEEFAANLKATWKSIFNDWFDQSAYKFDVEKMDFEYYTLNGVYIYVPVQAK